MTKPARAAAAPAAAPKADRSRSPESPATPGRLWSQLALTTGETPAPARAAAALQGGGQPLDPTTRAYFSLRFGRPLDDVRVHTDARASDSARSLDALAYTVGPHIAFRAGQFAPGTPEGDRLLAHELVHVIQQSGSGGELSPQARLEVSAPGDAAEGEAERISAQVLSRGVSETPVAISRGLPRQIARVKVKVKVEDTTATAAAPAPAGSTPGSTAPTAPGASAAPQGEDSWETVNPAYRGNPKPVGPGNKPKPPVPSGKYLSPLNEAESPDEFRKKLGPIQSISERRGGKWREVTYDLSTADVAFIVGQGLEDTAKGHEKDFNSYCEHMARAFAVAGIDTVEGQAVYLAHAAGETGFAYLTEGQRHKTDKQAGDPFAMDPTQLELTKDKEGPIRYKDNKDHKWSIDPLKAMDIAKNPTFKDTFIGRGPVQVTHAYNYARTLVVMEEMAKKASPEDAKLLWEAIGKIKQDPRQAANPKYSFLFSAAYMQMQGGGAAAARLPGQSPDFGGKDDASSWVAGGGEDIYARERAEKDPNGFWHGLAKRARIKQAAYGRALSRIRQRVTEADKKSTPPP